MQNMLIGDQWVGASEGRTLSVVSPSDGQAFDEIPRGTAHDVDRAVQAARASLSGAWGQLNASERGRIMMRIAQRCWTTKKRWRNSKPATRANP